MFPTIGQTQEQKEKPGHGFSFCLIGYSNRVFPFLEFLFIALQQILLLSVQLFSFMCLPDEIYVCHTLQVQM